MRSEGRNIRMNYKYVLIETLYHNGTFSRKCYGIAAISTLDNISVLAEVSDLSIKLEDVKQLVNLCNKEMLDIIHLENVACDYLSHTC